MASWPWGVLGLLPWPGVGRDCGLGWLVAAVGTFVMSTLLLSCMLYRAGPLCHNVLVMGSLVLLYNSLKEFGGQWFGTLHTLIVLYEVHLWCGCDP